MATSGSKSVTVTSHDTLKFSWSESSQSVANNKTTISWKMQLISDSGGAISSSASKDWSVTVNGTKYSGTNTVGISASSAKTLASGSTTIAHNSDGTKTFSYSFSQEFAITFSGSSIGTKSGSGTGTLDTIPRASTVSATSANIGSASTIKISRASSSFTHTLTYTFGSLSGTIVTKTTSTSVSWTLPTTFYAQVTTAKSKTGTITCTTYSGSTNVGSKTCSFTANVSSANVPTLSPNVYDSNSTTTALTGDSSKFVKYYSNAQFSIGASAKNSATIKSQSITCGSKKSASASGTLSAVESATFVVSATDSRGYTTSQTVAKTLINYLHLTCGLSASMTVDGIVSFKINGNYYNGSFGNVSNTLTVQYRYKASDGSYGSWYSTTATLNGNVYSVDTSISGLDYRTKYTIQARAIDKLETITSVEKTVSCIPVFDWGENDFNFNVPVHMMNDASILGTTTSGDSIVNITPCNGNNNCVIGYGGYENDIGQTNIYGKKIMLGVKTANTIFKPYYEAGDSISGRWHGAGFITSSGKNLYFTVPLAKPVIGNPTVTVTSNGGFMIRQGGSYCYGSASSTYVNPSGFDTAELEFGGSLVRIIATFGNTTNVTNNDTAGIIANIKITFS
ncbi:MAG: hypothetical protein II309_02940 [Bacilli bacterium]|nr:hypothetical protein [Bacilli bacterium]